MAKTEKKLIGQCTTTGDLYVRTYRGTKKGLDKYREKNPEFIDLPAEFEDSDIRTLSIVDDVLIVDPEKVEAVKKLRRERRREKRKKALMKDLYSIVDAIVEQYKSDQQSGKTLLPKLIQEIEGWDKIKQENPIDEE